MSQRHRIRVGKSKPRPFEHMGALETHARFGVARPCDGCGATLAVVKFTTFLLVADLTQEQKALLVARSGGRKLATVDLKAGKAVQIGQQAACSRCRPALEKAVARGPSYAYVDILEAPHAVMAGAVQVPVR